MAVTADLVSVVVTGDCCGHMQSMCFAGSDVSTAVFRFQNIWDLHGSRMREESS